MAPSALILDYGEVLTRRQAREHLQAMATLAGLPLEEFRARYWRHRHAYDSGLPVREYWLRVVDDVPMSDRVIQEIIDIDVRSWMDYRDEVWDLAARFRARGGRTAMLSNGVPEIISHIRADRALDDWFDVVVVSCEVGCAKPAPAIYERCLAPLAVPPALALFVDDRPENLSAAEALGMRTLHFTGEESVEPLRNLLDL